MNFIDFENLFYMFSKFECIYNHCLYLKSIIIWIILFDISIFFFVDNILFEHSSEAEKKFILKLNIELAKYMREK